MTSYPQPASARPRRRWLNALLPVLVIFLGIAAFVALVKTKAKPKRQQEATRATAVRVAPIRVGPVPVTVYGQGSVMAARRLVLQPEVSGRVIWHSAELVPGGRVRRGQVLVRINPQDYQLALKQQQAQVASQRLSLRVERARQKVAVREWELFQLETNNEGNGGKGATNSNGGTATAKPVERDGGVAQSDGGLLALREPQLRTAQIALRAAKSAAAEAKLRLSRTVLTAPFNGIVQTENVEIGQLVSPTVPLATLVGTDSYWVQISIPMEKLTYLQLPSDGHAGSAAQVWLDTGNGKTERSARLIRLLGDLDPVGRMARVLLEVDDPLGLKNKRRNETSPVGLVSKTEGVVRTDQSDLPLLIGSYVHVAIRGKTIDHVAEIPARALQADDRVLVMNDAQKLDIRQVHVVMRSAETVLVRGPLRSGERVVISRVEAPVQGMPLRLIGDPSQPATAVPPSASAPPPSSAGVAP